MPYSKSDLRNKIENAVNSVSAEQGSNTPDFILAQYLVDCLDAFDRAANARENWYSADRNPPETEQPRDAVSASIPNGGSCGGNLTWAPPGCSLLGQSK